MDLNGKQAFTFFSVSVNLKSQRNLGPVTKPQRNLIQNRRGEKVSHSLAAPAVTWLKLQRGSEEVSH